MNTKFESREAWLQAAIVEMTPLFEQHGYKIPPLRVSCGWPVRGGLAKKKRVLGECWDKKASEDKTQPQIFISPWLSDDGSNDCGVLPTLAHEVVHAVVGHEAKHGKIFGKCARAIGLEGKLTSTHAGPELLEKCKVWFAALGPYPHSQLSGLKDPGKKQSTRLIKCVCGLGKDPGCGYNVRITQKWLDAIGAPECPHHGEMTVVPPKEPEEGGDE